MIDPRRFILNFTGALLLAMLVIFQAFGSEDEMEIDEPFKGFSIIPQELKSLIFSFTDLTDYFTAILVSKEFQKIANLEGGGFKDLHGLKTTYSASLQNLRQNPGLETAATILENLREKARTFSEDNPETLKSFIGKISLKISRDRTPPLPHDERWMTYALLRAFDFVGEVPSFCSELTGDQKFRKYCQKKGLSLPILSSKALLKRLSAPASPPDVYYGVSFGIAQSLTTEWDLRQEEKKLCGPELLWRARELILINQNKTGSSHTDLLKIPKEILGLDSKKGAPPSYTFYHSILFNHYTRLYVSMNKQSKESTLLLYYVGNAAIGCEKDDISKANLR